MIWGAYRDVREFALHAFIYAQDAPWSIFDRKRLFIYIYIYIACFDTTQRTNSLRYFVLASNVDDDDMLYCAQPRRIYTFLNAIHIIKRMIRNCFSRSLSNSFGEVVLWVAKWLHDIFSPSFESRLVRLNWSVRYIRKCNLIPIAPRINDPFSLIVLGDLVCTKRRVVKIKRPARRIASEGGCSVFA